MSAVFQWAVVGAVSRAAPTAAESAAIPALTASPDPAATPASVTETLVFITSPEDCTAATTAVSTVATSTDTALTQVFLYVETRASLKSKQLANNSCRKYEAVSEVHPFNTIEHCSTLPLQFAVWWCNACLPLRRCL